MPIIGFTYDLEVIQTYSTTLEVPQEIIDQGEDAILAYAREHEVELESSEDRERTENICTEGMQNLAIDPSFKAT